MKSRPMVMLIVAFLMIAASMTAAQKPPAPKYDPATEATFKGTVDAVTDRECPVSGGMGAHVTLKLADGTTIEVHLALTKFVKDNGLILNKGDQIEVIGSKVKFEGVDAIFAREITRGNDTFVFRGKQGNPAW